MTQLLKVFLIIIFTYFSNIVSANNELSFELKKENVSSLNNDCRAEVIKITNGTEPYIYKWSEPSVSINSPIADGLKEGHRYTLTVVDGNGKEATQKFSIKPTTGQEKLNRVFGILVDGISTVMMVDVFALLNIYDPIIYDDNGVAILNPNGTPQKNSIPLIVVWLCLGAIYFSFKFKFINFRGMKHAIQLIQGKFDNPNKKGQISHFQALTTALSATVGLGNIAGVAFAIGIGGPGATFWMILMGIFGMSSKFIEATLGVKYRRIDKNGQVSGGPMYYLKVAFEKKKFGKPIGKFLAGLFAILLIGSSLGGGNMFQSNQSFKNVELMIPELEGFGMEFGLVLALLVGIVIIGGIKSIAKVTSRIVPFMASTYIITALIIIFMNFDKVDDVIKLIFNSAFNSESIYGGFIGVLIMGLQRASFSNEAGIGSAAIAHSAVKTDEPISEGIVAMLGPFIDTVIICSLTAFILLFTGYYTPEFTSEFSGSQLTSEAFGSVFPWFKWVILGTILLFAFSTLISWSYYGLKGFDYLFGNQIERRFGSRQVSDTIYKLFFLFFIVVGAASSAGNVLEFSDMMLLCMAFPNMIGLVIFAPRIKKDLDKYWQKVKSGEIKMYK